MPFKKQKRKGKTYYTRGGRKYTPKQVRAYYATGGFSRSPRKRKKR